MSALKHQGRAVRVLLLWPGTDGAAAGNFGVPQLVLLATFAREKTGAEVHIRDLECEKAFGPVSLAKLFSGDDGKGYDIIALGCYSSFDYLKCVALAEIAREMYPNAIIVAGGYHASARPSDIVFEGSPFDVCVDGEGEFPLVQIIESIAGGSPLKNVVLDNHAVDRLDDLPPSDWSFLARYRPIARKVASQAQVYLSRGCPFDCAFCMERAKREVSWRPLSVERAVQEIKSLHEFLDLRTWTVYLADALFGMKISWRRQFLEALAKENIPVDKFWLLIRVDLVQDEDLPLFSAANCGLGFGLESGDPTLLATIRKAGRLDDYLDAMKRISARTRELNVPWGANVIVGHPGETESTLIRSAKYLSELFLDPKGVTGFLSVDPFRLYPGSPIDKERHLWSARFGTKFYRTSWWHDGDQEFLAEWVDPSSELTYLRRMQMQQELLGPVLGQIEKNFVYNGKAREYFLRAVTEQHALCTPSHQLHYLGRYYAWQRYLGRGNQAQSNLPNDTFLAKICREIRESKKSKIAAKGMIDPNHRVMDAIVNAPREQFVALDEVYNSVKDIAISPTQTQSKITTSTVSAMHAYARAFSLVNVQQGDRVLDLGAGTGYGTRILSELVGEHGQVFSVEIDNKLVTIAKRNLVGCNNVTVMCEDVTGRAIWQKISSIATNVTKIVVGFALDSLPDHWAQYFPMGTLLAASVCLADGQHLVFAKRIEKDQKPAWEYEILEQVLYVSAQSLSAIKSEIVPEKPEVNPSTLPLAMGKTSKERVRLPVV